jgi:pimeloyl-ACP methyl ester carboxylesterase
MREDASVPSPWYNDQSKGHPFIQRIARMVGILAGSCLLLLLGLSLWNLAVTEWQHAHNPVAGDFYSVEGRQMHIYCTGTGSPTVIMEAGASATWLAWRRVQPELSQLTRVCSYDRAGHGWSEPRPGPRDAQTIARELHALLDQAGVQRPLVLAGHSAGGLYLREYARAFPAEVAGVVFIDSSSPQQVDELPGWRASYEQDKQARGRELLLEKLRVWSGWQRLMGRCRVLPSDEAEVQGFVGQYNAMMCRPAYVGGEDNELIYFEETFKQAGRLTSFGNVPLLIISRDTDQRREGMTANSIAGQPVWAREQETLKSLSPLSWSVIARGAGHSVHHDRLDLVVAEMTLLIRYLRGGPAPPFGTTTIE